MKREAALTIGARNIEICRDFRPQLRDSRIVWTRTPRNFKFSPPSTNDPERN